MNEHTAIMLSDVSKQYSHFNLNLQNLILEQGSIMGFIGPNGAGKSTTLRIIMGLVRADRGEVNVLGKCMPDEQVAAKWDIGFASEDMRLYQQSTMQWHIDFMRRLYSNWDESYASDLLKRFDLQRDQKIKGFSHGQRVKAGLLLILARRPRLLILDEPTTGLDPVARREVINELMEVLADERRSVLFSSHNTKDVEQLSDQITFIDRGNLIASQDKESFLESWRRIRIETPDQFVMPVLPGVTDIQQSGHLASVTVRGYDEAIVAMLKDSGASIRAVENMNLEEIFVAEVLSAREGANS